MSSFHGPFLFPSVSLSPSDLRRRGGDCNTYYIRVTSCPDKNAGAQDVRLYQYVIYITVRNRNITPVYKRCIMVSYVFTT